MSIADAVRARELEARVADLERRVLLIEQLQPTLPDSDPPLPPTSTDSNPSDEPTAAGKKFAENMAKAQATRAMLSKLKPEHAA